MDVEDQIGRLKAEAMALQFVVLGLIQGIRSSCENGDVIVQQAFHYAENVSVIAAMNLGGPSTGTYAARIAEVVQHLRAAVMDDEGEPKKVV